MQYGGGTSSVGGACAVWICHTIIMVEGVQLGSVASSVWTRVCSTRLLKLLREFLVVVFIWKK